MPLSSARDCQSTRRSGSTTRIPTEGYHSSPASLYHPRSESLSALSGPEFWHQLSLRAYDPDIAASNPPRQAKPLKPPKPPKLPNSHTRSPHEHLPQTPIGSVKLETGSDSEVESLKQIHLRRNRLHRRNLTPQSSRDLSPYQTSITQLYDRIGTSSDNDITEILESRIDDGEMLSKAQKKTRNDSQAPVEMPAHPNNVAKKRAGQQPSERPQKLPKTDSMGVETDGTTQGSFESSILLGEHSSASRNLVEYAQRLADREQQKKRIRELEIELGKKEQEHNAKVEKLKHSHEIALQKCEDAHQTALMDLQLENKVGLQQIEQDFKDQLEKCRLECQDIKKSAADNEEEQGITVRSLEAENRSLKKQLEDKRTSQQKSTENLANEMDPLKKGLVAGFSNGNTSEGAVQSLSHFYPSHSPTPTPSFSSFEETKTNNIRTIFTIYKNRYHNLHSLSQEIVSTTANMDLAAFGKFGVDIQRLRKKLGEFKEEDSKAVQ